MKKPTADKLTGHTARATLCIDLGNDQVKAILTLPNGAVERCKFPSRVQEVQQGSSSCLQDSDERLYLVGTDASPYARTGKLRTGKVDNAKLLTLHAIRLLTGFTINPFNTDVIYTTPSNKQFGAEVTDKLQRSHFVGVPSDPGVIGSRSYDLMVVVHRAVSQLEGYQSHTLILDKLKGTSAWLLDIGGGTVIATEFNQAGRILQRSAFNDAGVHALAVSLQSTEALAAFLPKLPSLEEVTEFLFTNKDKRAQAIVIDALRSVIAPAIQRIPAGSQVFLCGGGAGIRGISAIGKPVSKNPQWANIEAVAAVSSQILKGAK